MAKNDFSFQNERLENVSMCLTLDTRKSESKDSRKPESRYPVAVRVSANRKYLYYRTGLMCSFEEWEKIKRSKYQGESFEAKNKQLKVFRKVKAVVSDLLERDAFTLDELKAKLKGKYSESFSDAWVALACKKKIGTRNAYMGAFNSFEKHVGKNIPFSRVGKPLIQKWIAGMTKEGLSLTSQGMYLRACRAVINAHMPSKIKQSQYPFEKKNGGEIIKINQGSSRTDEFVEVSAIKKLMTFKAPESWPKYYADVVEEAIALWVFSYLGNGMNLADMAQLRYEKHYFETSRQTEFRFIRQKTADSSDRVIEIIIPIIPELREILDKIAAKPELNGLVLPWILDGKTDPVSKTKAIAQWNSNIRARLKAACKVLGMERQISMSWARHSFATNLTRAGVPERYISQAMGHSVRNVTQRYIGLFSPEERMEFNKMLLRETKFKSNEALVAV